MVLGLLDYRLMKHHTFSIRFKSKFLLGQSKTSTASRRSRSLVFAVCGVDPLCKKMAGAAAGGCQGVAQSECRGSRKIPPSIHICSGSRPVGVCNYGKGTTTPWRRCLRRHVVYEVRDLFPWEMLTKTAISCFLNVEKIWNSAQINLSSTLNFLLKIFCRHNNIHREIDQWNRRRFGAKWHVTVPNSVTPIKPIVCKLIHMSQGCYCQMTHKLHVYEIFISIFIKLWFREFFLKFMTKSAVFCRLVHKLNVSYETSIFRSMFMLHKYW